MKIWLKNIFAKNKSFVFLIILMIFFRSSFADWNTVPTKSMNPTIVEGDRVLVNKLAYDFRVPLTGISLYRFANPERGDIVEMVKNKLIINGKPISLQFVEKNDGNIILEENLNGVKHLIKIASEPTKYSRFNEIKVPENSYLVLGENRDNSSDSRVHGFIPRMNSEAEQN
jgi:signal peptidase I